MQRVLPILSLTATTNTITPSVVRALWHTSLCRSLVFHPYRCLPSSALHRESEEGSAVVNLLVGVTSWSHWGSHDSFGRRIQSRSQDPDFAPVRRLGNLSAHLNSNSDRCFWAPDRKQDSFKNPTAKWMSETESKSTAINIRTYIYSMCVRAQTCTRLLFSSETLRCVALNRPTRTSLCSHFSYESCSIGGASKVVALFADVQRVCLQWWQFCVPSGDLPAAQP